MHCAQGLLVSALVTILILVLLLVLVLLILLLVLLVLLILVLLLILILIHSHFSSKFSIAVFRYPRIPQNLGFILCFEQEAGCKSCCHCSGNPSGCGL